MEQLDIQSHGEHTVDAPRGSASVTVVIPSFNEERNIARLVHQVLTEPWDSVLVLDKIIIVDDCSDDGTPEIARRFACEHERVQVIQHAQRRGKNAGIRDGLAACRSDIVVILDADVSLGPQCLTKTMQLLADDPSLAASSCINEPLPPRSWRERASRFQAWFVAELGHLGHGSLLRVYGIRTRVIDGLDVPDTTHDDLYIPRWLCNRGQRMEVRADATSYVRPATGLRDFAKQTLRGRAAVKALDQILPAKAHPVARSKVTVHAAARAFKREPLGFLLYLAWLSIARATPTKLWLPAIDYSRHDQSLSTKDVSS